MFAVFVEFASRCDIILAHYYVLQNILPICMSIENENKSQTILVVIPQQMDHGERIPYILKVHAKAFY